MATLALGLGGAALGSAFGPLGAQGGWLLGSALGSALFPTKTQGPRLDDLKLHNSSYGNMTPFLYGTMRVAGNIIDEQPELTEHSDTSGGKGGPEVTNYTYTCSFAVRLCEGPIKGILRIWANGRLIYDHTGESVVDNDLPLTIYLGDEEQLPDPTLETIHGVGNVPGYRGIAYVVFTDLLLTEFGNTLPSLNFEVYTNLSGPIPRQVSIVSGGTPTRHGAVFDPVSGYIIVGDYGGPDYVERRYDLLTGALIDTVTTPCDPIIDPGHGSPAPSAIANFTDALPGACLGHTGAGFQQRWYYRWIGGFHPFCGPVGGFGLRYDNAGALVDGTVYNIGHPSSFFTRELCKWATDEVGLVTGFIASTSAIQQTSDSNYVIGTSDDGYIYVYYHGTPTAGVPLIDKFDSDLNLVHTWNGDDVPSVWNIVGGSFVIYNGMIAVTYANAFTPQTIVVYDLPTLVPGSTPIGELTIGGASAHGIARIMGGYCIVENGFVTLDRLPAPVVLADIVADLSLRSGLDPSQYDVDELTDLVDGYIVNQQATARDMIQPLRDAYFFDAVERDGQVVFVKRGHEAVIAIADDELAAHNDGEQVPPIVGTARAQEVDLPCVVNVDYVNAASDYQTGTQAARRQVTMSQAEVSLTLAISMSDVKAKAVADTQLYMAWMERNRFSFFTSRQYAAYEPTDVVTVGTRDMRLVEKTETRPGVVKWDAVEAIAEVLLQAGGGSVPAIGFTPSPPGGVVVTGDTTAYLLDLPLIAEADDPDGFYAAMTWQNGAGAGLYKSADGVSYASIASSTNRAAMGTTATAPGDFAGGNTFDEVNAIDVVMLYGELASSTQELVLNGANLAAVGDEVIQFTGAELVDVDTYRLTGLLRGRFGTEWAMAGHGDGEEFALLPVLRAPSPHGELHQLRSYKAVTFGKALADAEAQGFTNNGIAWQPYPPVLLGGGTNGAGDVTLNLTRRTRLGGEWAPFVDVPIGETSERYVWQIWNAAYSQVARIIETTTPTTTYTSAQQVTDFGAQQQTIYFTAGQLGSIGIGRQARGTAPGAGVVTGDPLAAIPPYQSPTSGSSVPPAPFDAINLTITWGALGSGNVRVNSAAHGDFDCSKVLVATFTTPSTTAANAIGRIQAVESVDGPVARTACLSRVAGDFSGADLGAGSLVQSSSVTVQFSVGTNTLGRLQLAASTTYYYNIKNDDGHGVCSCFTGDCSMFVELAKPPGL